MDSHISHAISFTSGQGESDRGNIRLDDSMVDISATVQTTGNQFGVKLLTEAVDAEVKRLRQKLIELGGFAHMQRVSLMIKCYGDDSSYSIEITVSPCHIGGRLEREDTRHQIEHALAKSVNRFTATRCRSEASASSDQPSSKASIKDPIGDLKQADGLLTRARQSYEGALNETVGGQFGTKLGRALDMFGGLVEDYLDFTPPADLDGSNNKRDNKRDTPS